MTSVLLIDDHELIRQGLRRAFERSDDFTVVGDCGTVAEGVAAAGERQPDVVVTDVCLPDGSGLDVVRELRRSSDSIGIVVLTMYADDEKLFAALEAGASAFVAKDAASDEVVAAARHAAVSRSFTASHLAEAMRRRMSIPVPQLSPREREILVLLAEGLAVGQIARQLFISESTVKTHVSRIYDKLGAENRAQALMTAVREGLVSTSQSLRA